MSEANHPRYGSCDGYGPNGTCSECTGLLQRVDGSVVDAAGNLVRKAPLLSRLRKAWDVLRAVPKAAGENEPF